MMEAVKGASQVSSKLPGNSLIDGWTKSLLGDPDVATLIMGQSPDSSTYNTSRLGLPFFQGKVDFGLRHPKATSWCSSPLRIAEPGDILVSVRVPVGDANIATEKCCIGRGVAALRPGPKADKEFLFHLLLHHKSDLDGLGTGATFKAINKTTLTDFEIYLPSLPEQQTIAAVLSKIQAAIEVQENIVATLKELKAATMAKLFREGLGMEPATTQDTPFGEVPARWYIISLSECAQVQTGIAKGRKIDDEDSVELPYLRVANVQDGYLELSEIKKIRLRRTEIHRYSLQIGDVLLTEGGDFDKLGRGYIWNGQIQDCVHQNHIFAVRADQTKVIPEFLAYLAQSPYGKSYFLRVAHKTTNLACINSAKLKSFPILLPELSEQQQIAQTLGKIDESVDIQSRKREALMTLFSSMLHLLLTGQIRVPPQMMPLQGLSDHDAKQRNHTGTVPRPITES